MVLEKVPDPHKAAAGCVLVLIGKGNQGEWAQLHSYPNICQRNIYEHGLSSRWLVDLC